MKNSKFLALCLSLVCAFVLAGVLATSALAAPQTVYVGSADFEYQGVMHTPDYASVADALAAMGTNGGTIIFTGTHSYADTDLAKVNNAPHVNFIGADADSAAKLTLSQNKTYYHRTVATYDNLTLQPASSSGLPFLAGDGTGRSITFGENLKFNRNGNTQTVIAGNAGWGAANDLVFNGGDFTGTTIAGVFGNTSAGTNTHVTINGGTMPGTIYLGAANYVAGTYTRSHKGNITFTLNGGTFNATQKLLLNQSGSIATTTTVEGKISVILNNDLADAYDFQISGANYIIKSTADGTVELTTEGSSSTAPTFTITPKDAANVPYVNGLPISTTNGAAATFTPDVTGTFNVTYAPYTVVYDLSFDANGGSGSQADEGAEAGEEVTLPTTTTFTAPAGKYFAGWGATAGATLPVSNPYTMPGADTTLYAIWYDSVYVNPDGSGTLTVGSDTYAAAYTSVSAALTALGSAGGTITFTGANDFLDTDLNKVAGAPYVKLVGADDTAKLLVVGNKSYYHKTNAYYENLTIAYTGSGACYFLAGNGTSTGCSVTIGSVDPATGLGINDVTVIRESDGMPIAQGFLAGNIGWGPTADVTVNSGDFSKFVISATYGNASAGDAHVTINGGILPAKFVLGGAQVAGTKTFTLAGNSTLVLNGGTYPATTYIQLNDTASRTSTINGKSTVIINNGLADTYTFNTTDINYVFKSTADGFVELTTEGSASTAPTLTLTPKDAANVPYVNGLPISTVAGAAATYTPAENGTFIVTYAPYTVVYDLSFDANGGSGSQAEMGAEEGESVTLPSTTTFTNGTKIFIGWGATAGATVPVADPYTMPGADTTLYAIWYDGTVYANADGSHTLTYGGTTYYAFDTVAQAVTKLGSLGGTVVFAGRHDLTAIQNAENASAPMVVLKGADDTAELLAAQTTFRPKCGTTFEDLKIVKNGSLNGENWSNVDLYFYHDGKPLVIGDGAEIYALKQDTTLATSVFKITNLNASTNPANIVFNSGHYDIISADGYNGGATGNSHYTINGGTFSASRVNAFGALSFAAREMTHTGNITVTINGGTFQNKTIRLNYSTNATTTVVDGAASLIINNDLDSANHFSISQFDYVVKSGLGGTAALTTEATASTAPTFTLTADDPTDVVYIDGVAQSGTVGGVYAFTPDATGTYDITYGPAPAAFADSSVSKAGYVAATEDAASKTYAIIASVQLADWVDVANISSIGFYGYTADSETAKVTLAATASVQSDLTSENKRFYAVIDEIPTALTSVVLKPFVVLNGTLTCAGNATAYVPDTIGASTYYGTQDELDAYFG